MGSPDSVATMPASAVIPTRNRPASLARTLASLLEQAPQPAAVVVVDASEDNASRRICEAAEGSWRTRLAYRRAETRGAAAQRNQGVAASAEPFLLFMDDDVELEPYCLVRLWRALELDSGLGGASAMIANQTYAEPGWVSRQLYRLLDGNGRSNYAGRCLGPGVNLLPENRDELPEVVSVDWLNLGCTLYRREALPTPPFAGHFSGYSLLEDLALSLAVGRRWRLANVRTARIFHDSQPGDHKSNHRLLARMELVNRHYVMTKSLGRRQWTDYAKLAAWELFQLAAAARAGGWRRWSQAVAGKVEGALELIRGRR